MSESASPGAAILFSPYWLNGLVLPNRIVMAPTMRSRPRQPGDVPTQLDARYYGQRAGAGLIVTEAAQVSSEGQGHDWTLGIHTEAQRDGWRLVTDAVHDAGGRLFLQLCHAGRVSPSPPEIARVVEAFRRAGGLAMQAGFDGVEVDGGDGHLIDQFLRATTNRRTDRYGGSVQKRVRFLAEVTRAVAAEVGANRTGVCLAPYGTVADPADPEIIDTMLAAADVLEEQEIAYLHLRDAESDDIPLVPDSFREALRKRYANTIIVAGRHDHARAIGMLDAGYADLVAFGRPFVAHPDLPRRLRLGLPLA
jgi:N-ethylmaleimide reductase